MDPATVATPISTRPEAGMHRPAHDGGDAGEQREEPATPANGP